VTGRVMPARLDVVIVNWNAGSYLADCVRALQASTQTSFELGDVVVVDNASSDGSVDRLAELRSVRVIENDVNRGFGAACNQGASVGSGELVLFLNPDTAVPPTALDEAAAFMTDPASEGIGICGVRMMSADGEEGFSCSRFPTLWMWTGKMLGLAAVLPRLVPDQRMAPSELEANGVVDQVIGAFFLIRRPLFEKLGGFDERFFMYLEEVDLAYRARELGAASFFLGTTRVFHQSTVSSSQVPGKRLLYLLRSRVEFAHKHWPPWQGLLLASLTLVVELPVRALVALASGRLAEARAVGAAGWHYVRYLTRLEPPDAP
jgi:N-acetylglucosaminyl-diphospho-decaprenol L-rhamnosyltransferase